MNHLNTNASFIILKAFKTLFQINLEDLDQIINLPKFEKDLLIDLCEESMKVLSLKKPLDLINGPLIVVGDLHGSLFDLIRIFQKNGFPPDNKYLFLGDYIDKGPFSTEVILILLSLLCKYPLNIFLLRGNHEFGVVNSIYGFKDELISLGYPNIVWETFQNTFGYIPIASLINSNIFALHGGLSPNFINISQLLLLELPIYNCEDSIIGGVVWSDPKPEINGFELSSRGNGYHFGKNEILTFLENNNLKAIFRGHQCISNGVENFLNSNMFTIFSSSNYCNFKNNKSGIIEILEDNSFQIIQFDTLKNIQRSQVKFFKYNHNHIPDAFKRYDIRKPFLSQNKKFISSKTPISEIPIFLNSSFSNNSRPKLSNNNNITSHKRTYGLMPFLLVKKDLFEN